MTPELLQKKIKDLQDYYALEGNREFGRLVVDKTGKLFVDANGCPLIEHSLTTVVKDSNETENTITHLISTPRIDYVRDVMNPYGCNDQILRKNKGVFWNHSWSESTSLPIGKNLWIKKTKEGVLAQTQYAAAESEFAAEVYRLVKGGYLNSYSIGFFANEWDLIMLKDLIELINGKFEIPNAGDYDDKTQVWYHAKWNCYEYSNVGVPMNQDAVKKSLQKAFADGIIKSEYGKAYFGALSGGRVVIDTEIKTISSEDIEKAVSPLTSRVEGLELKLLGIDGKLEQVLSLMDNGGDDEGEPDATPESPTADESTTTNENETTPETEQEPVETEGSESKVVDVDVESMMNRASSGAVSRVIGKA